MTGRPCVLSLACASLLGLSGPACSDDGMATVRVHIAPREGIAVPTQVSLSAYAARYQFHGRRIDGPWPTDVVLPVGDFTPWRLIAWGFAGDPTPIAFGTAEAHPAPTGETVVMVTLDSVLPADRDGDRVPDLYDDCPTIPDPDQAGVCTPPDGGPPPDGGGDAGGNNLVANADFEVDLAGWIGDQAVLSRASTAYTGFSSCQVCLDAAVGPGDYFLDDTPDSVFLPRLGAVYQARAWVRAPPGVMTNPQPVAIRVREWSAPSVLGAQTIGLAVAPDQNWTLISVVHTVTADSATLDVAIGGTGAIGDCFLVDDISLLQR